MHIKLKLHAIIAAEIGDLHEIDLPEGATLAELLKSAKINRDRAGFILINGRREPYDKVLQENDTVFIMPFLGGG